MPVRPSAWNNSATGFSFGAPIPSSFVSASARSELFLREGKHGRGVFLCGQHFMGSVLYWVNILWDQYFYAVSILCDQYCVVRVFLWGQNCTWSVFYRVSIFMGSVFYGVSIYMGSIFLCGHNCMGLVFYGSGFYGVSICHKPESRCALIKVVASDVHTSRYKLGPNLRTVD
jgi:hypothetical protein